jgi:hypothetical protein
MDDHTKLGSHDAILLEPFTALGDIVAIPLLKFLFGARFLHDFYPLDGTVPLRHWRLIDANADRSSWLKRGKVCFLDNHLHSPGGFLHLNVGHMRPAFQPQSIPGEGIRK